MFHGKCTVATLTTLTVNKIRYNGRKHIHKCSTDTGCAAVFSLERRLQCVWKYGNKVDVKWSSNGTGFSRSCLMLPFT